MQLAGCRPPHHSFHKQLMSLPLLGCCPPLTKPLSMMRHRLLRVSMSLVK